MNDQTIAKATSVERIVEYIPQGAQDQIKLSTNIIRRLLCKPTKRGALPTDEDCERFYMMCRSRRLNPFEGDCFLVGYDSQDGPQFSMITAHQTFLKRAELHPEYDGMQSGVIVKAKEASGYQELEGDLIPDGWLLLGGWAKVYFKSRKYPASERLDLRTFKKATQFWDRDPAGMIVKTAEASALRKAFPTSLGGLIIQDEQREQPIEKQAIVSNIEMPKLGGDPYEMVRPHSWPSPPLGFGLEAAETAAPEERAKLKRRTKAEMEAEREAERKENLQALSQVPSMISSTAPEINQQTIQSGIAGVRAMENLKQTVHEAFQDFMDEHQLTIDHLIKWAQESGNIEYIDIVETLKDIKAADLERFLKSRDGLLRGMKLANGLVREELI